MTGAGFGPGVAQYPVPVRKLPAALRAEVRRLAGLNARPPLGHRPWVVRPMRDLVGGALLMFVCLALGLPWLGNLFWLVCAESGDGGGRWYEWFAGFALIAGVGLAVFWFALVAGVRRLRRGLRAHRAFVHLGEEGLVWSDGYRAAFVPWGWLERAEPAGEGEAERLELVVRLADEKGGTRETWSLVADVGVPAKVLAEEVMQALGDPAWRVRRGEEPGREPVSVRGRAVDFRCGSCGASLPLRASGDGGVVCGHCGARSERPPEVEAALEEFRRAAAAEVERLGSLSDRVERLEKELSSATFAAVFGGCLWGGIFIFGGVMNLVYGTASGPAAAANGLAIVTAGLADIPAMLLLARWARGRVAAFRRLVAAIPSGVGGGEARCRVCGADLPASGEDSRGASRRGSGGSGARSKPTSAADIRRCGWCGVESLVLPGAPSAFGGDAAWSLADRIREGAPNLMQVEAGTYQFVLAMQKGILYLTIFLFVPNSLLYVVFEPVWEALLG